MNRDGLMKLHQQIADEAADLMRSKNADYSGGSEDVLANFRHYGMAGISIEQGIVTRMLDKMTRIAGMANGHEARVDDESIRDTIRDLVNYAVLLEAARQDRAPIEAARPREPGSIKRPCKDRACNIDPQTRECRRCGCSQSERRLLEA